MAEQVTSGVVPTVDATVFLGMHHRDDELRRRSLGLFCSFFTRKVRMNYEQVGICDAVIWQQSREVQDLYYPFMDRLHTDMKILREGYDRAALELALGHPELQQVRPEQALQAAEVMASGGVLATHDPVLQRLACLRHHLWDFSAAPAQAAFPAELQALYETSQIFIHGAREL